MLDENIENLEEKELDEEENKPDSQPIQQVEEKPVYEDKAGGRALNAFSKLFFVLTIIGTILTGVMVFLPIFLAIVGVISTIVWILGIIVISVFTIGLIWTVEEFKAFNSGWMDFNTKMFNSSNSINEFVMKVIPFVLISGGVIIALTWLFTILGAVFDKFRLNKYKGRIIALSIITVIYIVFLVLNIILHNNQ